MTSFWLEEQPVIHFLLVSKFGQITVPTRSLGTRERTLWKKAFFSALPKIQFLSDCDEFFFGCSHGG